MKSILVVLLSLTLITGLAGCQRKAKKKQQPESKENGSVVDNGHVQLEYEVQVPPSLSDEETATALKK